MCTYALEVPSTNGTISFQIVLQNFPLLQLLLCVEVLKCMFLKIELCRGGGSGRWEVLAH